MKKIFISSLMLALLLCGCQSGGNTDSSDFGDDLSKAQEIAVIPAGASDVSETITADEDIKAFIEALDLESWELKPLPEGAYEIGSFGLSQEETVKLGQDGSDGNLYDIASITLYDNSYVEFDVGGLDMTFEVSKAAADYLDGYFK